MKCSSITPVSLVFQLREKMLLCLDTCALLGALVGQESTSISTDRALLV